MPGCDQKALDSLAHEFAAAMNELNHIYDDKGNLLAGGNLFSMGSATNEIVRGAQSLLEGGSGVDFGLLTRILMLLMAVYVATSLLRYAQNYVMAGVSQRTMYDLRQAVDRKLSRLPLEQLSDRRMKEAPPYECFAFAANMPKWNTENPEVIRYLVSIAEQWTREYGIDAWRLDVPDEVSLRFLHAFRTRMRSCNAAVYVIGEIWQDAGWWLEQSVFDGVMDYPLYHAIRDFAMTHTDPLEAFAHRIRRWYAAAPEAVHPYQWAFCSNHDVPRALSLCGGNKSDFQLAYVLAALLGGNLSVYYGDEIAMDGGQDPDNRRPMRWTDPEEEIRGFFHSLLRLKRDVLRHCRLTAMELTDALYLHFDGPGYGILAVVTERGQAVTPQLDASDSLLLEAPEGHAAEGTVQGFAVFRREVTHDGNT